MNNASGYFAYRHQGTYYQRYIPNGAQISEFGQKLADCIPRNQPAFKVWVHKIIRMLETKASSKSQFPYGRIDAYSWTTDYSSHEWTYVIDLDNRMLTIGRFVHLRLDNMPPRNSSLEHMERGLIGLPPQYFASTFNLWPNARFDIEERQRSYDTLNSVILPVGEWGAPARNELTMIQQIAIAQSNHFLRNPSYEMAHAYDREFRLRTGRFCWDLLCAATSGVHVVHSTTEPGDKVIASRIEGKIPRAMVKKTGAHVFKCLEANNSCDYCWVRGCLVTFCVQLSQQGQAAHEIEQMVQKMHHDGQAECVGIILSGQREMIVVAVDNGLDPTRQVRHTPVLDIRPSADQPGEASDGLLLLVHLLSPPLTITPLPWRAPQPRRPDPLPHQRQLPAELLQHIIRYADTDTYLALCKVSRLIRNICLSNPRIGEHTILRKVPAGNLAFAALYWNNQIPMTLRLSWIRSRYHQTGGHWLMSSSTILSPAEAMNTDASDRESCW